MAKPIYTCLWFENQAKEAADFYCSIFPNSKILNASPIVVNFELNGIHIMALNGKRPTQPFNESFSLVLPCEDQKEIDYYWEHFTSNGGKESMCGWCSDKYGISWQVIPTILGELMSNPAKAGKVVDAFMKMKKMDIATLKNA
ncbi:MAG: VOC family protein [Bacteroidetes bacterium]|nr:VOC family protein [Bacteroidota bacterium]